MIKSEIYDRVKDYSKERNKVITYFEIGRLLSKAGKEYGKNIIKQYSDRLVIDVDKKYNINTLYKMRRFYEVFSDEKLATMWPRLSWSHCRKLMCLKNVDEIKYYIAICEKNNLTQRQLCDKIKNHEYDRLSFETKNKLVKLEQLNVDDLVPEPIIIKNEIQKEKMTEYVLKTMILNNLDDFLLQLGNGFTYVGNEYKIKIEGKYNYIDLLLFNYEFNCFVVIELKTTELKKEHIGQIQVYMNYIDDKLKKVNQDKTIGIIICKENYKYIIKYCSDKRIISRKYELV